VLSHDCPLTSLFATYFTTGFAMADRLPSSATAMFATHLLDLLCEAVTAAQKDRAVPSNAVRAALFVRACRLIGLTFSDPALGPERIAQQLGISTRTLHRIFAEHGETVMQHLFAERSKRAASLLLGARGPRTITEIAFACGFADLTHFGRV